MCGVKKGSGWFDFWSYMYEQENKSESKTQIVFRDHFPTRKKDKDLRVTKWE